MKYLNNYQKGKKGEDVATRYLQKLGYQIIATNYTKTGPEIDIIAFDNEQLVIVEVKSGVQIEDLMDQKITAIKKRRIERAALEFLYYNHIPEMSIRFEILVIALPEGRICHFRDEFFDD